MSDLPNCPVCGAEIRIRIWDGPERFVAVKSCSGSYPHGFVHLSNADYRALCALVDAGRKAKEKP